MSEGSDDWLIKAGLIAGAGILGYNWLAKNDKRQAFKKRLQELLSPFEIQVLALGLGGGQARGSVWHLTVDHPALGPRPLVTEFPAEAAP